MAETNATANAHNFQDLTGKIFGNLAVVERDRRQNRKRAFWKCRCECGKERIVEAYHLTHQLVKDCGCQRGDRQKEAYRRFVAEHPQSTAVAIELSGGHAVIVDHSDYEIVSRYYWHVHRGTKTCYARGVVDGKRILLHHYLLGYRDGGTIDHINGNGLDNRRCNLRWATSSEQQRNIHGGRGRSLYKGVSWAVRHKKWVATISLNGKNKHLGYFDQEDAAAEAYDAAATEYYGKFACVNFPETGQSNESQ